jgi:2-dehydro-3-deoxygalactonokinase
VSHIIGVDWGTTNLRAFRFGDDGAVREVRRSTEGISSLERGDYETALSRATQGWRGSGPTRIVICGMAGSRNGWIEAPYAPCPAEIATLARAALPLDSSLGDIAFAPGLTSARNDRSPDVMRGEETQILGALDRDETVQVIAPGTHSKWAQVEGGRITDFRTFMTGEMFALLKAHSILRTLMRGDAPDDAAFALGVRRSLDGGALLNLLFSVRTEGLFERIAPEALASYLSGVLIGAEICEATARNGFSRSGPILVVGAQDLVRIYQKALATAGANQVRAMDGEAAAARGLWRFAHALETL